MSFSRSVSLSLAFLLAIGGCNSSIENSRLEPSAADDTGAETTVLVQLNWYPEAEHGGVYQAAADGTYAEADLQVEIRPGGRATPVAPELALGRVHFAFANADDVVVYRREGMDIVAVLAAMQDSPRCILVREDSGVKSFEDLAGMTLQRQTGRPFLKFMRSRNPGQGDRGALPRQCLFAGRRREYRDPGLLVRRTAAGGAAGRQSAPVDGQRPRLESLLKRFDHDGEIDQE